MLSRLRNSETVILFEIEHPDVLKFVHAKQDLNLFHNFNIFSFYGTYIIRCRQSKVYPISSNTSFTCGYNRTAFL
jgi:hypothetical protein